MASGDHQALGELYDRHCPILLATALRILGELRAAEDLVHDVFVEAWHKASDYDAARANVRTWLLVRLRSRALDRWRRSQRIKAQTMEARTYEEVARPPDDITTGALEQTLDQADGEVQVREAVATLPASQRQVLELAYYEGLTSAEIAERLGIPIGTVKSRTAAALGKLRVALADLGGSS